MEYEDILRIFRKGTPEERLDFVKSCPSRPAQEGALALAASTRPESAVLVLGALSTAYSFGQDAALGVAISRAGHELAKEAYVGQGEGGTLLLSTVINFASNLLTGLNLLGRFDEAIAFADDVLPFYERQTESGDFSSIRIGMISALFSLKRMDEAKALIKNERDLGTVSGELDRLAREIEDLTRAPTSLPSNKSQPWMPSQLTYELMSGFVDAVSGALTKSSGEMNERQARKIFRDSTGIFLGTPTANEIEMSLKNLLQVRNWTKANGSWSDDSDILWGIYLCFSRLGRPSEAADALNEIRAHVERLRAEISDPLERGSVSSRYPYLFPCLCKMLSLANRPADLLDAIEAAKGRAVADLLTLRLCKSIHDRELYLLAEKLLSLMKKHNSHYLTFFVDEQETYAVLVTKEGQIHSAGSIPIGKDTVRRAALNVDPRSWGQSPKNDPLFGEIVEDVSSAMSPLLAWLKPFFKEGVIQEGDHICYSPDEHLHHLPLHYVRFSRKRLVDYVSVSRVHGAHALSLILSRKRKKPTLFISLEVPTIQDMSQEDGSLVWDLHRAAEVLEKHLRGETITGVDAHIDGAWIKKLQKRIVHFATHGIFQSIGAPSGRNPYHDSGLVMAASDGLPDKDVMACETNRENVLTPERILERKLNFAGSHVTLQACVSGLAEEGIGGDALGLEWALVQSQASSILSSHWYISAELSANFFERLYGKWLGENNSLASAWRNSVLELKKKGSRFGDPYCWAAFSLSGDWR